MSKTIKNKLLIGVILFTVFLINICYIVMLYTGNKNLEEKFNNLETKITINTQDVSEYFLEENLMWGGDGISAYKEDYMLSARYIDMKITEYKNENINLPDNQGYEKELDSLDDYTKENYSKLFRGDFEKFGNIAIYFWNVGEGFLHKKEFDVDGDGSDEIIVDACGVGGNHCPHTVIIIKDDEIIFSSREHLPEILSVEDGNGFILKWIDQKTQIESYCCPLGEMRTRFVFNNGKFIPIFEQKMDYVILDDSLE